VTAIAPAPARASGWSRWILFVSLALNVFLLGAWAAQGWRHYALANRAPLNPAGRIERLAEALPPADAEKLRTEFRAHQGKVETAVTLFRQAQRRMGEALRAEPFNPEALRTAMAEARAARGQLDAALQEVIASAVATMTPEGRRNLADWTPYRRSSSETSR
jgi:uncharacterized membrane protein